MLQITAMAMKGSEERVNSQVGEGIVYVENWAKLAWDCQRQPLRVLIPSILPTSNPMDLSALGAIKNI